MNSTFINQKIKILDRGLFKEGFLHITLQLMSAEEVQNCLNMLQMSCSNSIKSQDVIQVDHHKLAKMWVKDIVDDLPEIGRGISQYKRHDQPLVEVEFRLECYFLYVIRLHTNLMIS